VQHRGRTRDRHGVLNFNPRVVIREGERVSIYPPLVWILEGKRGTLTIREPANAWVNAGGPLIGTGSWKVVRGTGEYAGIVGTGRNRLTGVV
jgi:hypothetical protein